MGFITMAFGFLKAIPWKVWAVLGAVAAIWIWLGVHDRALTKRVEGERNAYWQGREKESNDRHADDMNRKRGEISDLVLKGIAEREALDKKLREQAAADAEKFEKLKNRRPDYVTPLADSRCALTRGFVLQFNAGAAAANGTPDPHDPAAPQAGAELVDAPAGVPLSTASGAVSDTQAALGQCRRQVTGWQEHWAQVEAWYASLLRILTAPQQGLTP